MCITDAMKEREKLTSYKSLGQGCGHNLIAVGGVACAIAIKALLEQGVATGKVVLFGTPAEGIIILGRILGFS